MLYNGVFGCHGNTCYDIFIGAILSTIHSIGPINVCAAKTVRRTSWRLRHFWYVFWSGTLWNQPEVSTSSGSKVMAQIVDFVFSVTLTLTVDLFFVTCTAQDVLEYPCEVAVLRGDMPGKHTYTHTETHIHTPKVILIIVFVNVFGATLIRNHLLPNLQEIYQVLGSQLSTRVIDLPYPQPGTRLPVGALVHV